VGVPTDLVVFEDKGHRPIMTSAERVETLENTGIVDQVEVYHSLDFLPHLQKFTPNVIFVSAQTWGQEERHINLESWAENRKVPVIGIPYKQGISTTVIIERIIQKRPKT